MVAAARASVSLWPVTQRLDDTTAHDVADAIARHRSSRAGLCYGLAAYSMWGVFPLYFHLLSAVAPWIVLCHRIFWSVLFLALVVTVRGEWKALRPILRSRRNVLFLSAGGVLIALNWLIFIYGVGSHQIVEVSLGYFINPLLSIALGVFFLRERLRRWQWVAVLIAAIAVANLTLHGAGFPWIAVSAAGSFGFYGFVRKKVDVNSLHGLLVETAILFPLALVAMVFAPARAIPATTWGLLSMLGVLTAIPLIMFGAAVRRLQLSTVGFLQYIGPTGQLLVALLVFHEPLQRAQLTSFALCWLGIAVYTADSLLSRRPQEVADEPE
jgi:chloramphenicol-sensitive protein RarD